MERTHRSLLNSLRSIQDTYEVGWPEALTHATIAYNTMPNRSIGYLSPYELYFGRKHPLLDNMERPSTAPADLKEHFTEHRRQLKVARAAVYQANKEYTQKMRERFGGKDTRVEPGMLVLAQNKTPATTEKLKLRPRYYGPFVVHEVLNKTAICESTLSGRITFIHKQFIRPIPEKNKEVYKALPTLAKLKLGGGHSFQEWMEKTAEGKILEEFTRNLQEKNYGDELIFPEDRVGSPNMDPDDKEEDTVPVEPDPEDSNEEGQEERTIDQKDDYVPPYSTDQNRRVRFAVDMPNKEEQSTEVRHSAREKRTPDRLDL